MAWIHIISSTTCNHKISHGVGVGIFSWNLKDHLQFTMIVYALNRVDNTVNCRQGVGSTWVSTWPDKNTSGGPLITAWFHSQWSISIIGCINNASTCLHQGRFCAHCGVTAQQKLRLRKVQHSSDDTGEKSGCIQIPALNVWVKRDWFIFWTQLLFWRRRLYLTS